MKKIKVIIADDHKLIRRGFTDLVSSDDEIELIGDVPNGEEALEIMGKQKPDVAVIDYSMPPGIDGIEVAVKAEKISPGTSVIILTNEKNEDVFHKAISKGVMGYILKESTEEELVEAIKNVYEKEIFVSRKLIKYLINYRRSIKELSDNKPGMDQLTPAEKNVLALVAENLTSREIADKLCVSVKTVQTHRFNICTKLNLKGMNALLLFAIKNRNYL